MIKDILDIIEFYDIELLLGLFIFTFISFLILLILNIRTRKKLLRYKQQVEKTTNSSIEKGILNVSNKLNEIDNTNEKIKLVNSKILEKQLRSIQKVNVKRYNAFDNVGSNQSFSICMLDDRNNGFILSSIYANGSSISYLKPIEKGSSFIKLSEEEEEVLNKSLSSN